MFTGFDKILVMSLLPGHLIMQTDLGAVDLLTIDGLPVTDDRYRNAHGVCPRRAFGVCPRRAFTERIVGNERLKPKGQL